MADEYDERAAASTQSNIRDIVSLVKSGKLDKSEAFKELRQMLKNPSHPTTEVSYGSHVHDSITHVDITNGPDLPSSPTQVSMASTTPRFSKEDRRVLINKLIEKKRQDRLLQSYDDNYDPEEYGVEQNEYDEYPEQPRMDAADDHFELSHSSSYGETDMHDEGSKINASSMTSSAGFRSRSSSRERPQSAGRAAMSRQHFKSAPLTRRAADDSRMMDLRSHKIAQEEASTRSEMFRECTFTPQVKPLPSSYGPPKDKGTSFYDRVMRWQREKDIESTRRKSMVSTSEVEGCTFQPRINPNSVRSVKMNRGETRTDTSIRLYESSSVTAEQKAKFIEDELQREQRAHAQECTFKPRLVTKKSGFSYVERKFDKVKVPTVHEVPVKPIPKECTFTPKIKGVSKNMSSAKLYVNMDVVERLTKPVVADPQEYSADEDERHFDVASSYDRDRPVMDVAQFMGSLQQGGSATPGHFRTPSDRKRPSSAPRTGRTAGAIDKAPTEDLTEEEKEARKQSFKAFLGRQTQTLIRKDKKTEELVRNSTPGFRPALNKKSLRMVSQCHKGEFLSRVQQDVLRREQEAAKVTAQSIDAECSFQPEVSRRAQNMRPRSVYEMSRGDLHKKETNSRILRLRTEQEELKNLTFQPQLSAAKSRKARSSLQLHSNPGGFLERHMIEMRQQDLDRSKIQQSQAESEMKDCTFKPQTIECPAYVKRIAKSLAVVKAARSQDGPVAPAKPQWK